MKLIKNEFTIGIFNLLANSTLARAIVYTIGHILIAATCTVVITGAHFSLAAMDAIIEPLINGVWYYVLDHIFVKGKKVAAALDSSN